MEYLHTTQELKELQVLPLADKIALSFHLIAMYLFWLVFLR